MTNLAKNEAKSTAKPTTPKAVSDKPVAPANAKKAASNVTAEAVVTKVAPKAAPKTGDRPAAPAGAKKSAANKRAATKAAPKAAAKASTSDRPVIETGKCDCCGRDEVLAPYEVVKGISINLCMVCKETVLSKAEAIRTEAKAGV